MKYFLCCLLLTSLSYIGKCQAPQAEFTASRVSGCSPISVTFTDQSTGNPRFWNWDFGNGQISNQQNPSTTYSQPGSYSVTLVVTNADGTNGITKTDLIVVNPSPRVSFNQTGTIACLPATIGFTDNSTTPNGNIVSWDWNFGDGTTSTERNPSHSYGTTGFYSVRLAVTDEAGCTMSATAVRSVRIVSGVEAEFATQAPPTCQPPFNISFTDQSSGPGTLTYQWDFGNGLTSTQQNPQIPYTAAGNYTISLRTTSQYGCFDTVSRTVSFTGIGTDFTSDDSACINATLNFSNNSAQTPVTSRWFINNNLFSEDANATFTFNTAGVYNVKLVNQYTDCTDSITKAVTILAPPAVSFSSPDTIGCQAPLISNFQDNTPNSASWFWNFGDGTTSSDENPQHTYSSPGLYNVRLRVVDRFGCTDSLTRNQYVRIVEPQLSISNAPTGGCIPFTFSPLANVTAIDGVASYFWDFGNGNTSTSPTPTTTYTATGNYNLLLRITTNGGCVDTLRIVNGVRTGTPTAPAFSISNPDACAFGAIQFNDLTPAPVNQWLWNFGDGETSALRNPSHAYSDTGTFNVSLTGYNNGCPVTVTQNAAVRISPPIAAFDFDVNCSSSTEVSFTNRSIVDPAKGPVSYLWRFGDPTDSTSTDPNPVFQYPALGSYTVSLTVTNDTCSHTITREIQLVNQMADFSISGNPLCRGQQFSLSAINSDESLIQTYQWQIGTAAPFSGTRTINRTINTTGTYDVRLTITDINGCTDTKTETAFINVVGPTAAFVADASTACVNSEVSFTNNSTSASPVIRYNFDFGDGTVQDFTAPPFIHRYTDTGSYNVRMTVFDAAGCSHAVTLNNAVRITGPVARFAMDTTAFCPNSPVSFVDSSSGTNLTYFWEFGDGSTSTLQAPVHTYSAEGAYSVSLIVTDDIGCSDSLSLPDYIRISRPVAAFSVSDSISICPPFETFFTFAGSNHQRYYWDFGDGSEISVQDEGRHFYNSFGRFEAKVFAVGAGGCIDSATRIIYVHNPASTVFNYSPLTACNELTVDFEIQTLSPLPNPFRFSFGDGQIDSSQATNFSHFYSRPGRYQPTITYSDNAGCLSTIGGGRNIEVIGAIPLFGVDNTQFCDSGTVYFTNFSIGNDPITGFQWTLGDGTVSTDRDVIHRYTQPGNYTPTLQVTTQSGCVSTLTDTIDVYRTPRASIVAQDTVCLNDQVLFQGILAQADTNTIQWNWNFGNGNSSTMRDAVTSFSSPGDFNIQLDTRVPFGCNSTTSRRVHVVPPPSVDMPAELTAISGAGVIINPVYTGPIVNYLWTPSSDLSCYNCPTPHATPRNTKDFMVTVTDRYGCTSSSNVRVVVICSNQNVFIPNTFSPNGDGANDRFYPRGIGLFTIKSLRIFNRWGEMVFERTNFSGNSSSHGWDGTFKGRPADSDVYVYSIEVICENGETFPFKGNVMLLR